MTFLANMPYLVAYLEFTLCNNHKISISCLHQVSTAIFLISSIMWKKVQWSLNLFNIYHFMSYLTNVIFSIFTIMWIKVQRSLFFWEFFIFIFACACTFLEISDMVISTLKPLGIVLVSCFFSLKLDAAFLYV